MAPLTEDSNMFLLCQLDKRRLIPKIHLVELFDELILYYVSIHGKFLLRQDMHLFGEAFDLSFASATV
ncbi:unnamed protein product [Musa textilis]